MRTSRRTQPVTTAITTRILISTAQHHAAIDTVAVIPHIKSTGKNVSNCLDTTPRLRWSQPKQGRLWLCRRIGASTIQFRRIRRNGFRNIRLFLTNFVQHSGLNFVLNSFGGRVCTALINGPVARPCNEDVFPVSNDWTEQHQ